MTDNNLFKPTDQIQKQKLELSLSLKEKLSRMKTNLKHTLLLDLSGSMHDLMPNMQSKRDALEDIVRKLPSSLKKFAFSNHCQQIEGNHFPEMGGSTALHRAFEEIKKQSITEIILITDGQPDNERLALEAAAGLKIETIYIGPEPRPDFLEKLSKVTGGGFVTVDMLKSNASLELENKIKGLLGA